MEFLLWGIVPRSRNFCGCYTVINNNFLKSDDATLEAWQEKGLAAFSSDLRIWPTQ